MGGWGCGGTLISKGFGYSKEPDYCGYDEYPLSVPTVILEGFENGSTQGWGDSLYDDVIVRRDNEIVVYKRVIRSRRWIEFNGRKILCDEQDVPDGYETLGFENKNELSVTIYDLESKTKCVYKVTPEKEYVPFNGRDIEGYLNKPKEGSIPLKPSKDPCSLDNTKEDKRDDYPF